MSKVNEIPSQFTEGPDSHSHLCRALHFLGKVSKEITAAWKTAREAEWAWKRATSLDLIPSVVAAKNHLAERLRIAEGDLTEAAVVSAQRILDDRQALLDAVPEEAVRWKTIEGRQSRKREFESAQGTLLRMRAEQKPVAIEDVRHVAELRKQVVADEQALREEGKTRTELREAADVALDDLRSLVVDALVDKLMEISKEGVKAIGKDAEIYFEYRELLDKDAPQFKKALLQARVIKELARDLGAELDLVVAFGQHFPEKDKVARDLMEAVIEGDRIKLGTRDQDRGGDSGILDMQV